MNLTELSGSEVLRSFWEEEAGFDFPVLVLLLAPGLAEAEVKQICRDARWLDRSTGGLVLVVLFWKKSPFQPSPSQFDDDSLRHLLLEDQVREEYLDNLRNGLVDEASAIANTLKIPHRELPCLAVLDDPKSRNFYRLPVDGTNDFRATLVSLRDYLHEQYPDYCKWRERLLSAQDKLRRYNRQRYTKKSWKRASQESVALLEAAGRNVDKSMPDHEEFVRRLEYVSENPNDERVLALLKEQASSLGVRDFLERFERERNEKAEQLSHGASGEDLRLQSSRAEAQLANLTRPSVKGFVRTRRLGGTLRSLTDKETGLPSTIEKSEAGLKEIAGLVKYLSTILG